MARKKQHIADNPKWCLRNKNRNRYGGDMVFVTLGPKQQQIRDFLKKPSCYGNAHYGGGFSPPPWV
jgi:hypothetical protein